MYHVTNCQMLRMLQGGFSASELHKKSRRKSLTIDRKE